MSLMRHQQQEMALTQLKKKTLNDNPGLFNMANLVLKTEILKKIANSY